MPARVINDSMIACAVPEWRYANAVARIVLYDSTFPAEIFPVGSLLDVSSLSFRAALSSPTPVAAAGGTILLAGKYEPVETYDCRFEMLGLEVQGVVTRVDESTISCKSPSWPRSLAARVAKLKLFSENLMLQSPEGTPVYISVYAELIGIGVASCDRFVTSLDGVAHSFGSDSGSIDGGSGSDNGSGSDSGSGSGTGSIDGAGTAAAVSAEAFAASTMGSVRRFRDDIITSLRRNSSLNDSNPLCVPEANATGGFRLQIYGWGIDPAVRYECHFTDANGNLLVAGVEIENSTSVASDRVLIVAVPRWNYDAGLVNVTLVKKFGSFPSERIPHFDLPVVLVFKQRVEEASALWFVADCEMIAIDYSTQVMLPNCWPLNVTVKGAGFYSLGPSELLNRGDFNMRVAPDYKCKLVEIGGNLSIQASFVTAPSSSQLNCWFEYADIEDSEYGSQLFALDLTYQGAQLIDNQGIQLELNEAWFEFICSDTDCRTPASGGRVITVFGIGFHRSVNYYCHFSNDDSAAVNTLAGLPGLYEPLVKGLVVYGRGFDNRSMYAALFEGTAGDGSLIQSSTSLASPASPNLLILEIPAFMGREGLIIVEIWKSIANGAPDSWHKISAEQGASVAHPRAEVLTSFIYGSSWGIVSAPSLGGYSSFASNCYREGESVSALPNGITECWSPASGGLRLQILGAGFFGGFSYTCRFTSITDATVVVDSPASVISEFNLFCHTPSFENAEMRYEFSLRSSVSGEVPRLSTFGRTLIYVATSVAKIEPSSGAA